MATDAAATLTNTVTVSGGGDLSPMNNSAEDSVTVTITAGPSIEGWRQIHFGSAANAGAGADTNVVTADGLPNLMKYAFGLDPNVAASAADQPQISDTSPFTIRFRRSRDASDVTVSVLGADSINGAWTNIWSSETNAYGGGTNDHEIITIIDPVPPEDVSVGRFLRLNVTRP